jgi:hypothetical protein
MRLSIFSRTRAWRHSASARVLIEATCCLRALSCFWATREVWYYDQPLPEGRKNYIKTKPLQHEEFAECLAWWGTRQENNRAWRVKVEEVLRYNDIGALLCVNPNAGVDLVHLPPEKLVEDILGKRSGAPRSFRRFSVCWVSVHESSMASRAPR